MTVIETLAKQSLQQKGLEGLGLTMPVTTPKWVNVSSNDSGVIFDEGSLNLNSSENWLSPFAGLLWNTDSGENAIRHTLQKADGTMVTGNGILIQLFPQAILRIRRLLLLKTETENEHTPLRANGIITRQVPAFVFAEGEATDMVNGSIYAGEDIGLSGSLSFYDEQGHIIHPLYVASMVNALLGFYPALSIDGSPNNQLTGIVALQAASKTVRLIQSNGSPYLGGKIVGISEKAPAVGLFTLDDFSGTDSELQGEVKRQEVTTEEGGDFPIEIANKLLLANTCYGRMLDKVAIPKMLIEESATPNWIHDFFTIMVVDLRTYLTGTANEEFNGTKLEPKPEIRLNQHIEALSNGNKILAQLQEIFSDSPEESILATPNFDLMLRLPQDPTATAWPNFPTLPLAITPTPDEEIYPADFKNQVENSSIASFITDDSGAQPTEVLLTLRGIPLGAAVRVFNREFVEESTVKRGDGGGGGAFTSLSIVAGRSFNGEVILHLEDPLGLKRPDGTITVPTNPELIFDLMIVRQNPKNKRLFGALSIVLEPATVAAAAEKPDNVFASISEKGICRSPILGLTQSGISSFDFSSSTSTLNSILAYLGEVDPRDAPRQPTMARREILAAAKKTEIWHGVISGGILDKSMHNAQQDLGSAGSPGGAENASTGIKTKGLLAYDVGRMAFRRSTSFYERIASIRDDRWAQPANPAALNAGDDATEVSGLFAGSLLQTISPFCETPELALLKPLIEPGIDSIPATLDELIDFVNEKIEDLDLTASSLPGLIGNGLTQLRTLLVNALNGLKNGDPLTESQNERSYNEMKRELASSFYGRRDSQWALENAIKSARKSIYIETPGYNFTEGENHENYSLNLIQTINNRLSECPGLKIVLCVPKHPDYSKPYNQWAKSEVKERFDILQSSGGNQVVVFHPVGFPGRPSNISCQTVLVDDVWAMVGSSSFRRRGLTFDGSNDLVFTGYDRVHGKCIDLITLRKELLSQRLGIDLEDKLASKTIQLDDFNASFRMIREMLVVGGLGKIERLWNGRTSGTTYIEPTIHKDLVNPEGMEFNALAASIFTAFSNLET